MILKPFVFDVFFAQTIELLCILHDWFSLKSSAQTRWSDPFTAFSLDLNSTFFQCSFNTLSTLFQCSFNTTSSVWSCTQFLCCCVSHSTRDYVYILFQALKQWHTQVWIVITLISSSFNILHSADIFSLTNIMSVSFSHSATFNIVWLNWFSHFQRRSDTLDLFLKVAQSLSGSWQISYSLLSVFFLVITSAENCDLLFVSTQNLPSAAATITHDWLRISMLSDIWVMNVEL